MMSPAFSRYWPLARRGLALIALVLTTLALLTTPAHAELEIPDPLKPWVGWVKYELPELDCAWLPDRGRECAWPSQLHITADDKGGRFELVAWIDTETSLTLPGDKDFWPQDVRGTAGSERGEKGEPLVVGKSGDFPTVRLKRGAHVITGDFLWPAPPEVLRVPPEVGWVNLRIKGTEVPYPRLDGEGRLWLRDGSGDSGTAAETDSLRVSVYRMIEDGVPLKMTTGLDLKVSGSAREISLGRVLLPGSRPSALHTAIPTQVSAEGMVKVYAKPGTHHIKIESLIVEPTTTLQVPSAAEDSLDPQEVWVWIPDETLRSVEISGLTGVDAERTSLPADWRGHSTYLAKPGETLTLKETRRGEEERAPNLLNLERELWLDLDGVGYTVRDSLTGTLNQGWRLNHSASGVLGHVNTRRRDVLGTGDLLITNAAEGESSGVELRQSTLGLTAELRLETAVRELDIVGWDHDVQSLSAQLNLPPGWELLGGQGVDRMPGTWFASWTLFDFFFVLMVALALGKLCGWRWSIVAGAALCLSHGYGDAPEWLWIHLLATLALLRVLPSSWFRQAVLLYRAFIFLILVVVLAGYCHDQIRFALHPQIPGLATYGWGGGDLNLGATMSPPYESEMAPAPMGAAPELPTAKMEEALEEDFSENYGRKRKQSGRLHSLGTKGGGGNDMGNAISLIQVDPNARVQTGPGVPTWQWNSWSLAWTGPVRKDHKVSLWLLSPWMSRTLSVLRVLFLLLMAFALIARKDMRWEKPEEDHKDGDGEEEGPGASFARSLTNGAALIVLSTASLMGLSPDAHAQRGYQQSAVAESGQSLGPALDTLRDRLKRESSCVGPCVVVSQANIQVSHLSWTLEAEVHVQKDSAWSLPGPTDSLQLKEVRVDGEPTSQLRREPGGLTMIRLPEGRHTLLMRGQLTDRKVVTLQFHQDTRPRRVSFTSEDWAVDGISATGIPDSSIQLTRRKRDETGTSNTSLELSSDLPPWFQVQRHLAIGLPWQMDTTVSRDNSDRPQLVKVPLVKGEQVVTADTRVEEDHVLVDFPRGVSQVSYQSQLPITPHFQLSAAANKPWSETWTVVCSRIWRCAFSQVPPIRSTDEMGTYSPRWKPWPGELLTVDVLRPEGTPGQASTVDEVHYTATPGQRLFRGELKLTVRASQGDWQKVTLPEGAELQTVKIDGADHNIRPQGQVVSLPLNPGQQVFSLTWQQPWDRGLYEEMPPVHIGSSAVNAHLTIHRGDGRWLLWATGPAWGPAVLLWGHLVLLLILAFILGRLKGLPLKTYEWFLLSLGMVQLPFVALVPVVGWFAALAWRQHAPQTRKWPFNMVQLALIGLTLAAAGVLFSAIHSNLLVDMDMQVEGANSTNSVLRWYVDQVGDTLPAAGIVSLPLLVWRLSMLVWALWLVGRLLKWVPWGWERYSFQGLWRSAPKKERVNPGGGAYADGAANPGDQPPPLPDQPDRQPDQPPAPESPQEPEPEPEPDPGS